MNFTKILVPPLAPLALLLLLSQGIKGMSHGAPEITPVVIAMATPVVYVILCFCNFIDTGTDALAPRARWLGTCGIILVCGILLPINFMPTHGDPSVAYAFGGRILVAAVIFLPMAVIRRHVLKAKRPE